MHAFEGGANMAMRREAKLPATPSRKAEGSTILPSSGLKPLPALISNADSIFATPIAFTSKEQASKNTSQLRLLNELIEASPSGIVQSPFWNVLARQRGAVLPEQSPLGLSALKSQFGAGGVAAAMASPPERLAEVPPIRLNWAFLKEVLAFESVSKPSGRAFCREIAISNVGNVVPWQETLSASARQPGYVLQGGGQNCL
jgi:hypothetical protein